MFQTGDKVIYHGGEEMPVPIGAKGIVRSVEPSDKYAVDFKNLGYWLCKKTSLRYVNNPFLLHDKVKIIGPVGGGPEFFGFEGTVTEIRSNTTIKIHLELNTGPRDLFVYTSSLERIESEGSRWWV